MNPKPIVAEQPALESALSVELMAVAPALPSHNPLPRSEMVHCPGAEPGVHLFGDPNRVSSLFLKLENRAIYLQGRATHPHVAQSELLRWCDQVIASGNIQQLRDLHGLFVLIVDDRRNHTVTFVSDILGIRPWFVGGYRGRLVAASNVLSIAAAGLSEGNANYDEICAWLRYNQPTETGSVVSDYRSMKPATIATFRPDGSLVREQCYGEPEFGMKQAPSEQVIEETFNAIATSIRTQTQGLQHINLPLSGGYDSRMAFAIASQLPSLKLHVAILNTREYEVELAQKVTAAMNHPLEIIPTRKRILDLFDDPFCLTPGGFITGRNLTCHMARKRPGMALLSGFMGDGVMRGGLIEKSKIYFAKDSENLSVDDINAAIDKRYTFHGNRLNLLNDGLRKRVETRAIASMRKVAAAGLETGRPTIYADTFCRNRLYYSNIILQHLDTAEGIAAYCNFASINARVKYHHSCFNHESYPKLFAKYFPQLSGIPHSIAAENNLHREKKAKVPPTRHLRRWSADIAAGMLLTGVLDGAKKKKIFSLLPSGLLGETLYQEEITFIYKLMSFERTLQKNGVRFEWNQI